MADLTYSAVMLNSVNTPIVSIIMSVVVGVVLRVSVGRIELERDMFSLGIIILAIAFGHMYSAELGWVILGSGLIIAALLEWWKGKELE